MSALNLLIQIPYKSFIPLDSKFLDKPSTFVTLSEESACSLVRKWTMGDSDIATGYD